MRQELKSNIWKLKLKSFLNGLEMQEIDNLLNTLTLEQYKQLGAKFAEKVKDLKSQAFEIDCPDCKGKNCDNAGKCDYDGKDCTEVDNCGEFEKHYCLRCKDGKIKVAEVKERRDE